MDVFSFSAIMRIMEQSPNHFTEPMSRVKRIDGMKYHFDQLTDEELAGIRGHLVVKHLGLVQDISTVESEIDARRNEPLPFEGQTDEV